MFKYTVAANNTGNDVSKLNKFHNNTNLSGCKDLIFQCSSITVILKPHRFQLHFL